MDEVAGADGWAADSLEAAGLDEAAGFTGSDLTALLEITKRRRTGVVFTLGIFGLLFLPRGELFAAVTLRFNIKFSDNQTKIPSAGSEKDCPAREKWLLTEQLRSWELRTPED